MGKLSNRDEIQKKMMWRSIYIKVLVPTALLLLWCGIAWLISNSNFNSRIGDQVKQNTELSQIRAEELTNSIKINLNYLAGIPGFFTHAVRVIKAVSDDETGAEPSQIPYETRHRLWTANPSLNDLDQTLAIACDNFHVGLIFVVNAAGDTIATSNWNTPDSLIGTNFADRDYFRRNKNGLNGEQYAVGRKTHIPGLYFSSPIFIKGKFMGAVVAKTNIPDLAFLVKQTDAFVTDNNGVIILSHNSNQELLSVPDASISKMSTADKESIYMKNDFPELQMGPWGDKNFDSLLRIKGEDYPLVMASKNLPEFGLTINVESELLAYFELKHDQTVYFLFLSALGSLLGISMLGGLFYVRSINEARERLGKSELRYKTLEAATFEGIIISSKGRILDANEQLTQILGYDRHELIGMSVLDIIVPEDIDKVKANIEKGAESHIEHEMLRKDGLHVTVEAHGQTIEQDGISIRMTAIRDITERKQVEQLVLQSNNEKRLILESTDVGIYGIDTSGQCTFANTAGSRILGYEVSEMIGKDMHELIHHHHKDGSPYLLDDCPIYQTFRTGRPSKIESEVFWSRNQTPVPVEYLSCPINNEGVITGAVITFSDITKRKQDETELRIAATAFESQEGMLVTDANSVILRVNDSFTKITGYSAEEVIGKTPRLLNSGRHDAVFYAAMWKSINSNGSWQGEIWNRRKNGEVYPEQLTITAVKDSSGTVSNYVAALNDITLAKTTEDEIKHLAFYDPLTRLPNRRLLLDRLKQALASSSRSGNQGALLFIDLDNFKNLNDTLGHDFGDLLLQQVAQRLESCVREGDTVARLGGDEFVVMLEELSEFPLEAASQTETIGIKVLTALNQPYRLGSHAHHSTPSIGATLFNKQNSTDELMKQADIAMYQSKKAGRNTLRFFDQDMQFLIDKRMSLEEELRKAIDDSQFHLYYQIQVDHTQSPLGAEALIRWIHPKRGLISPAEFIPIAEEMGLIIPIGWWVLKTACAQIKAWQNQTHTCNLILSINVSAKQFHKDDFAEQVKTAIQLHDINPRLLKLELTEGMLLDNIDATIASMYALRDIGIGFSLDDFGTGYSSLQYLKRLPLTQLKIDQSFVREIPFDNSDKTIVSTIIAMAQSLNLDVIAEGVETEEQQEILQRSGCIHYQGYLYGKPVPIEQFEILLTRGSDTRLVNQTALMLRLNWHKSYECGESTIDQEHHKLFDLANTLIESAFTRNENPKGFNYAMEELLAHVVKHFADEEAILAIYHYADLDDHERAHKMLVEHALKLRDKASAGDVTIGELVNFIAGDVVAQHMLKVDRKFYSLFHEVGPS